MSSEHETLTVLKYTPITYDMAFVDRLSDSLIEFLLDKIYPGERKKYQDRRRAPDREFLFYYLKRSYMMIKSGEIGQVRFEQKLIEAIIEFESGGVSNE